MEKTKLVALGKLSDYIEGDDESQYSVGELHGKLIEYANGDPTVYSANHMKNLLQKRFGERLIVTEGCIGYGRESILTFKGADKRLLHDAWYEKREKNEESERARIVLMAAKIIKEDIQSKVYDNMSYPQAEQLFERHNDLIPPSLKLMVEELTSTKKSDLKIARKQSMICNSIISLCRPRTFISPI